MVKRKRYRFLLTSRKHFETFIALLFLFGGSLGTAAVSLASFLFLGIIAGVAVLPAGIYAIIWGIENTRIFEFGRSTIW